MVLPNLAGYHSCSSAMPVRTQNGVSCGTVPAQGSVSGIGQQAVLLVKSVTATRTTVLVAVTDFTTFYDFHFVFSCASLTFSTLALANKLFFL
jgi:hypothetical protein